MSKHNRDGLVELFGKLEKAILISTPAVEVGVDFDADTLITEECDGMRFSSVLGVLGVLVAVDKLACFSGIQGVFLV